MSASPVESATARSQSVVIIGAGVAGLTAASFLREKGWDVELWEQRHDLVGKNKSAASYNLTLSPAGRYVLAMLGVSMEDIGRRIVGRRILDRAEHAYSFRYGRGAEDHLLSVPRHALVERLAQRARESGVRLVSGVRALRMDPAQGDVLIQRASQPPQWLRCAHLIGADGVFSACRDDVARSTETGTSRRDSGIVYTTLDVPPGMARAAELDPQWIYFTSGRGATIIGLPNATGSFSLVVEWVGNDALVIANQGAAEEIIGRFSNDRLLRLVPNAAQQLVGRRVRKFSYVDCQRWETDNVVLMGDAAHALPPYLGSGANTALVDALAFSKAVAQEKTFVAAARSYERERQHYVSNLDALARDHERALVSGQWGTRPWRLRQRCDWLAEKLCGRRTVYQQLVFDIPMKCVTSVQERI